MDSFNRASNLSPIKVSINDIIETSTIPLPEATAVVSFSYSSSTLNKMAQIQIVTNNIELEDALNTDYF